MLAALLVSVSLVAVFGGAGCSQRPDELQAPATPAPKGSERVAVYLVKGGYMDADAVVRDPDAVERLGSEGSLATGGVADAQGLAPAGRFACAPGRRFGVQYYILAEGRPTATVTLVVLAPDGGRLEATRPFPANTHRFFTIACTPRTPTGTYRFEARGDGLLLDELTLDVVDE